MQVEERRYKPSPEFSKQANAQPDIYERSFDEFWTEEAKRISWGRGGERGGVGSGIASLAASFPQPLLRLAPPVVPLRTHKLVRTAGI